MNAPKEKKFNGEVYLLVDAGYAYKLKAKRDAIYLRRKGYYARIVNSNDGTYALYRRHKNLYRGHNK